MLLRLIFICVCWGGNSPFDTVALCRKVRSNLEKDSANLEQFFNYVDMLFIDQEHNDVIA